MVSIGKLGAGQENYYLEQVAEGAEDYYAGQGEAPGRWKGELSHDLGLSSTVEPDQLTAMLIGGNPATGKPLGLRAVGGRGAVPGFDVTFSVPKSASLLWALGDQETGAAVNQALDRSVLGRGRGSDRGLPAALRGARPGFGAGGAGEAGVSAGDDGAGTAADRAGAAESRGGARAGGGEVDRAGDRQVTTLTCSRSRIDTFWERVKYCRHEPDGGGSCAGHVSACDRCRRLRF